MYSAFATAGRKREWFLGVGGRTGGRVERVLIGGVCLLLLLWVNPAALSAGVMAEPYNTKRCGVPRGVTQLTYDDSDYRDVNNVVRLARAARRLDVGLGIFQLSEQTRRTSARPASALARSFAGSACTWETTRTPIRS